MKLRLEGIYKILGINGNRAREEGRILMVPQTYGGKIG